MKRTEIKQLFSAPQDFDGAETTVCGWVRTIRDSKAIGFIELNDGSAFKNLQVILEQGSLFKLLRDREAQCGQRDHRARAGGADSRGQAAAGDPRGIGGG